MNKENAKKKIQKAIDKDYADETQEVRDYLSEVIFLTFENLELDYGACHDDGRPYTSKENLDYALTTIDGFLLEEARRETKAYEESRREQR